MEIIDERKDRIHFVKKANDKLVVELVIDSEDGKIVWVSVARMEGRWNFFTPKGSYFTPVYDNEKFSDEELKMIKHELLKLLKEIKENHKYRLKVLNKINDEYKTIWELL